MKKSLTGLCIGVLISLASTAHARECIQRCEVAYSRDPLTNPINRTWKGFPFGTIVLDSTAVLAECEERAQQIFERDPSIRSLKMVFKTTSCEKTKVYLNRTE